MKIAGSIEILMNEDWVTLRPSLRCAMVLERARPGSFQALAREIMDGSLTAAVDIIEPHTDLSREYLAEILLPILDDIKPQLLAYVMACTGIDPDAAPAIDTPKPSAKSVPFAEYLLSLYRIGTGWLGWTPEETLHATITEISEAQTGKLDMLKAIYGSAEKQPPKDDRPLDQKFKSIFGGIGTVKATPTEAGE